MFAALLVAQKDNSARLYPYLLLLNHCKVWQSRDIKLLALWQAKTDRVGQNEDCRDSLPLAGLARHSGNMLNFPLQTGSTSMNQLSQTDRQTMQC